MSTISNVSAVTLREFRTRAFSRTFVVATALLIVSVVAIALAPVILAISASIRPRRSRCS